MFERVTQTDLRRDYIVFHEVICYLEVLKLGGVVRFNRELEIKDGRLLVRVLKPASLDEGLPQGAVAASDYENLDVGSDTVLLSEDAEVDYGLLLLFGFVSC